MKAPKTSAAWESRPHYWLRVLRPLLWWSLLVLVLFGIRTHQIWIERTRLTFSATLEGRPVEYESRMLFDGIPLASGNRIPLFWRQFTIEHPKAKKYSTNLFVWYGANNLGSIQLERTKGVLAINAYPQAQWLVITGPEISLTLTNTTGMTSSVPTDDYVIQAYYAHWKGSQAATVRDGLTTSRSFIPRLGVVRIEPSHADVSYQLRTLDHVTIDSGMLPATIPDLPAGDYELLAQRKSDQQSLTVTVEAGETNNVSVEFVYGSAYLETDPPGATVFVQGARLGETPLLIGELKPGSYNFSLLLNDYEQVADSLSIAANQTNRYAAKLVSHFYTIAINQAREYFAQQNYDQAAQAAAEALKYEPDNEEAKKIQHDGSGLAHVANARALANQGNFDQAINELNSALAILPENESAKELLANYTAKAQERAEQERKRREQELAEQQRQDRLQRLRAVFKSASASYENTASFSGHQMIVTNTLSAVAVSIYNGFTTNQPMFDATPAKWPQSDIFVFQARQRVGLGYRDCLIVGTPDRENQTLVLFQVFEYEHPPDTDLLGGLLHVATSVTMTSQDPNVAREMAEKFQQRIVAGVQLVWQRISSASNQTAAQN